MNNKKDSDCDVDIPFLCLHKRKQVGHSNPIEEIKTLLNIEDPLYLKHHHKPFLTDK